MSQESVLYFMPDASVCEDCNAHMMGNLQHVVVTKIQCIIIRDVGCLKVFLHLEPQWDFFYWSSTSKGNLTVRFWGWRSDGLPSVIKLNKGSCFIVFCLMAQKSNFRRSVVCGKTLKCMDVFKWIADVYERLKYH